MPEQAEESVSLRPPLVYCHQQNKVVSEHQPSSSQAAPSAEGSVFGSTARPWGTDPPSASQGPLPLKSKSSGSDEDIDICSDDEMVKDKGLRAGHDNNDAVVEDKGLHFGHNNNGVAEDSVPHDHDNHVAVQDKGAHFVHDNNGAVEDREPHGVVENRVTHFIHNSSEMAGTTRSTSGELIDEGYGEPTTAVQGTPADEVPGHPGPTEAGLEQERSIDVAVAAQAEGAPAEGTPPDVRCGSAAGPEIRTVPFGGAPLAVPEAVSAGLSVGVPPLYGAFAVPDGQDGTPGGASSASSPEDSAGALGTEPEVEIVAAGPELLGPMWPHVAVGVGPTKGPLALKNNAKSGKASPGPKPPKKPSSPYILFSVDFRCGGPPPGK